jgi:NAD+ diphosphatase
VDRELPHVALSSHAHNREGLRRTDDTWLAGRWADPSTLVLVVAGTRLRLVDGTPEWISTSEAPDGRRILLGEREGVTRFAVVVDPDEGAGEGDDWTSLRGAFAYLMDGGEDAPWLFHAVGLAEWLWATSFCPRCGGGLELQAAGHELRCTQCGKAQFPRTDPAVIMAVVHGESILLGRQRVWPADRWSTLAGFVEPGETFEDAVRREVMEEVGVPVGRVDYFGNQPWPLPASLMVGFVAHATSTKIEVDGSEIEEARWFARSDFERAVADGEIKVPQGVSISSSLLIDWYGGPLPGSGW